MSFVLICLLLRFSAKSKGNVEIWREVQKLKLHYPGNYRNFKIRQALIKCIDGQVTSEIILAEG